MLIIGIDPGISGAICFFENGEVKEISSRKNLELIFFNHPLKSKQLKPKKFYVAEHPIYKNKCFVAAGENYELFPFSVNSALKKTTNLREYLHSTCRWIVRDQVNYKKNQIIPNAIKPTITPNNASII